MLQITLIGNIGADAKFQSSNGHVFTTFRVAHTDRWKDDAGQVHESTTWVDCIMDGRPKVLEYLKKGQMVYCTGACKLRVYSSEKDRCMKAGLTINVGRIELLGGKSDDVPSKLYKGDEPIAYAVQKWFNISQPAAQGKDGQPCQLHSESGKLFLCDENGWVTPATEAPES